MNSKFLIVFLLHLVCSICEASIGKFFQKLGNGLFVDHQRQTNVPLSKLATTPLYYLCNARGQQYLQDDIQSNVPKQKIIVHYMSSEDAGKHLEEYGQAQQQAGDLRIKATSMESVMKSIQAKKQSRKLGRQEISNVFRIQPSTQQLKNAKKIGGILSRVSPQSIPMFTADGLAIQRANGLEVTPYYFCLEDLKEDWSKLVQQSKEEGVKLSSSPKTRVRDFTDVMCLSRGLNVDTVPDIEVDKRDTLKNLSHWFREKFTSRKSTGSEINAVAGIIPPRRELAMMKGYYSGKLGLPSEYSKAHFLE